MEKGTVHRETLLASLPPAGRSDLAGRIADLLGKVDRKVMVLDDDPTGTQTVHGIPIVTKWTVDHLTRELLDSSLVSYVLTNSRSIDAEATIALHQQICRNLCRASERTGRDFVVISRSDSTLRGHFWEEMSTLSAGLGRPVDGWVVCPFFEEGGRLTIDDVHYVAEGDRLVPAAETPFAEDAAFGYRNSDLRDWVAERSGGRIPDGSIESLSIQELRSRDSRRLQERIGGLRDGRVLVVNAAQRSDLEAAVHALLHAESQGKRFLYRSAASLVAVRGGIAPKPLLEADRLVGQTGRGLLVVVGSYVPKTTEQLEYLRRHSEAAFLELDVARFLGSSARHEIVSTMADRVTSELMNDGVVVVHTSRQIAHCSSTESLSVGKIVSGALVEVVRSIGCRPRLLIAKGGITSSDIATEALGVERSLVVGQVLPGVPVWECGQESRYPGMAFVVFPGNVGARDSLSRLVAGLR
jgi:uncharacterized protein YgbK (DUF1537 family)